MQWTQTRERYGAKSKPYEEAEIVQVVQGPGSRRLHYSIGCRERDGDVRVLRSERLTTIMLAKRISELDLANGT